MKDRNRASRNFDHNIIPISPGGASHPKTDPSFWNFGLLAPHTLLNGNGNVYLVETPGGADYSSFLPNGKLAYYSKTLGTIHTIDAIGRVGLHGPVVTHAFRAPKEIADVSFFKFQLFLLDWNRRVVIQISLSEPEQKEIGLQCEALNETSRLYVDVQENGRTLIFVGPTVSGRILVRSLGPDRHDLAAYIETTVNSFSEIASLGSHVAICSDTRLATLFIYDGDKQRLLACNWELRAVKVLVTWNLTPPTSINRPNMPDARCFLAYYPATLIKDKYLDDESLGIVHASKAGGLPYNLFLPTLAGDQILRWIEMGGVGPPINRRGKSQMDILIGKSLPQNRGPWSPPMMMSDLREASMKGAGHLGVSAHNGELTITLGDGKYVLVLIPATSRPDLETKRVIKNAYVPS